MKHYLAALRYTQISLGLGDPQICNMPQLEYIIKGGKKQLSNLLVNAYPSHRIFSMPLNISGVPPLISSMHRHSGQLHACAFLASCGWAKS